MVLLAPVARSGTSTSHPPAWFVADALCVHSGWHYTARRMRGQRPAYVLWRHGYWRTWKLPYGPGSNGEGSWDAANYGYGGGMQMDAAFQGRYGSEFLARYGAAGRWPVAVQLLVAWRGWIVQGWGAWPNTSRACGLR
jgi:hypothetical protein